jgi:F-type H+-transporting ATPase subunit b
MESLVSTFHIDWKIIIAQVINLAIVFLVLYLFALKPLKKLMADRSEKISKGITDAKDNALIVEKTRQEYDKVIARARTEADELFQKGKKEALAKKEEMLELAKTEVNQMILAGKKTLESEKIKIVEEAKKEIVSLAMLASEKILSKKSDTSNI